MFILWPRGMNRDIFGYDCGFGPNLGWKMVRYYFSLVFDLERCSIASGHVCSVAELFGL